MKAYKNMRAAWLCGIAAFSLALAGCGGSNTTAGGEGGNAGGNDASTNQTSDAGGGNAGGGEGGALTGAGATFPAPLYSKWFEAYQEKANVQINYQPIGSGGGIQQLTAQTVDFGASDAPLKDDDKSKMQGEVLQIPTVAGAVAVVYNAPDVQKLKLSGDVLAGIYLGEIKKWDDPKIAALNAGAKLPSRNIVTVHRSDGSGTTSIFTSYLEAVSPAWAKQVGSGKSVSWPTGGVAGKGNDGVAAAVKQTPGSIGYVELAYAMENEMQFAALRNKAGQFVEPSIEGTTAAAEGAAAAMQKDITAPIINAAGPKTYPIAGFTYIMVYKEPKDPAKGKQLVDFLKWAMTDGQGMAKDLHYAPLPAPVVKLNDAAISSIKTS